VRRALAAAVLALAAGCGEPEPIEVPEGAARAPELAKPLGTAMNLDAAREDEGYLRALTETFTSLTPENAMKWEIVHPERDRWAWEGADEVVDFARRTGKRVRGHPAVWDQQLPAWVADADPSAAEAAEILREHVRTLVGRYRGRIESWDVVNEPFEDDGTWTRSVWFRALGPSYVAIAFRAAREADPDARLFLNEIAAEREGPKLRALVGLARALRERDVPIDGVGLQNHTKAGRGPEREELDRAIGRFAALGLDVELTEMDVVIGEGRTVADQAATYRDAAEACAAAPRCTGLTVWGVTDRWSWLGEDSRPLPFDAGARPKPALAAVRDPLR
jgi:endo-1,4-beta-xylanase